jgi:GT2 family glycosyltransferase
MKKTVCLAILNYNGINHLEHLLPSIPDALVGYDATVSVVVLDNRSSKGDGEWMKAHYPQYEFVSAPNNEYMYSYNWLATQRSEDIFILLNNDTRLTPGFFEKITRHFVADDVFSVCARSLSWDGESVTCGPAPLERKHGFYRWYYDFSKQELAHTIFSSSGFMAVDRKKFLEIGGFSRLYFPMYCDDLDLGFRAWRKGWRSIYDPESTVYHRENGSGESDWVRHHLLRNALLFEWSSLPTRQFAVERGMRILNLILKNLMHGNAQWLSSWLEARNIWARERKNYKQTKISEEEYQTLLVRLASPVPQL